MFNHETKFTYIDELRNPLVASDFDYHHIKECRNDEVRVVNFTITEPMVAIGKQQHTKYVGKGINVIRKATNGTAVYFDGTEISLSVVIGKDTMDSTLITTTLQKWFVGKLQEVLDDLYGIKSNMVKCSSKHNYKPAGCFNALTKGEVSYGESNKLIGSSFTRIDGKVFGHMMMYVDTNYKELDKYIDDIDNAVRPISLKEIVPNVDAKELVTKFFEKVKENE